jgi:hypothetical protein
MNTIATQERIPKQVVLPATDVVGLVQNTKVLRALNAGWATLEDLKFLTPLFALAQDAVYLGAEASVDEIGGQRKAHLAVDEAYRRSMQYGQALEILSVSRMPEGAAPSFLQHYRSRCAEMTLEQSPDRSANDVAWLVADLMLASVQHALQKAGLIADGMVEPTRTVATLVDGAGNNALAVHLELLTNLYTAMRYQRVLPSLDRIQARVSLEIEAEPPIALFPGVGEIMCRERDDARDIEFTVERYPCTAEVLDPRVVRIRLCNFFSVKAFRQFHREAEIRGSC